MARGRNIVFPLIFVPCVCVSILLVDPTLRVTANEMKTQTEGSTGALPGIVRVRRRALGKVRRSFTQVLGCVLLFRILLF